MSRILIYFNIHFCALFHVPTALLPCFRVHIVLCFSCDFLVLTPVFMLMTIDYSCMIFSVCSLTPALKYDNDYWIHTIKHNTENADLHPVSYMLNITLVARDTRATINIWTDIFSFLCKWVKRHIVIKQYNRYKCQKTIRWINNCFTW